MLASRWRKGLIQFREIILIEHQIRRSGIFQHPLLVLLLGIEIMPGNLSVKARATAAFVTLCFAAMDASAGLLIRLPWPSGQ